MSDLDKKKLWDHSVANISHRHYKTMQSIVKGTMYRWILYHPFIFWLILSIHKIRKYAIIPKVNKFQNKAIRRKKTKSIMYTPTHHFLYNLSSSIDHPSDNQVMGQTLCVVWFLLIVTSTKIKLKKCFRHITKKCSMKCIEMKFEKHNFKLQKYKQKSFCLFCLVFILFVRIFLNGSMLSMHIWTIWAETT